VSRLFLLRWSYAALMCALVVGLSMPALGQVELGLTVEHEAFLVNEAVVSKVLIRNVSDVPLVFGNDYSNAKLTLRIRRGAATDEAELIEKPLVRDLVVMPGDTGKLLVELSSQFQMTRTGVYRVSLGIELAGKRYRTREILVDVVTGIELVHERRPISGYLDLSYDYSLRYWARNGGEYLFLSVSNKDEGMLYGTFLLGRLLRVHAPRIEFLSGGEIKVLHQSGSARLTVSTFMADRAGISFEGQEHFRPDGSKLN
jgi:hypothetical protein